MNNVFSSILKDEFASFLKFIKVSIADIKAYRSTLSSLDAFLHAEGLAEKKVDSLQIARWLDGFDVHISTKKGKLSKVKRFSGYLSTLGIMASLPELPRNASEFKPYVFSQDEMERIFETADDLMLTSRNSRITAEFPVLLRIL